MNETRIYVAGMEEECKEFTIFLTWYHSAAGRIGSINKNDVDGTITLNLIVPADRKEDVENWAIKHGLTVMY